MQTKYKKDDFKLHFNSLLVWYYNELISDIDVYVNVIDAQLHMNPFHLCMKLHAETCGIYAVCENTAFK